MEKTIYLFRAAVLSIACLAAVANSSAQTTVKDYEPGTSKEGITYFLPKTVIKVTVTSVKSTYTPGELCKYADRYMRLQGISDKEETHHELKSVSVSYAAAPDESKAYHITYTTNSIAPQVQLSEDGILLAIRTENPLVTAPAEPAPDSKVSSAKDSRKYLTEDMLMAASKAKLAELVAHEIYEIRDSKNSLVRGESDYMPADGEGLKIMVQNLQDQEDALLQLFTGVTVEETTSHTFDVIPEASLTNFVVARFSRKLGLLDSDNLAGSPIYIDVKSLAQANATPIEEEEQTAIKSATKKAKSYDGVVYNVPVKANVTVHAGNTVYVDDKVSIAQFGATETLSSKLFGKKATTKVTLDPITGGLAKIEE